MKIDALKLGSFEMDYQFKSHYCFFACKNIFDENSYEALQNGFLTLPWKEETSYFYKQYSAKIEKKDSSIFSLLYAPSFFFPFKQKVESLLQVELRNVASIVAHKLISAQEIGIHNDFSDPNFGYENYRFIFQFGCSSISCSGGELSFHASEDPSDSIKTFAYEKNRGVCFEITPYSFHQVSSVVGERYTLVMYLWQADKKYDGSGVEVAF